MATIIVSNNQLPSIKEGVIKGLEIASGAKSSATYYHKRSDQIEAVRDAVSTLYAISKELPIILAAQRGVTGFFIQEVLINELSKGESAGACNIINPQSWYDQQIGARAIDFLVLQLEQQNGTPYVLRMFEQLRERKVNNSRTRRTILSYIIGHDNFEFMSVKYRAKLVRALRHAVGQKRFSKLVDIAQQLACSPTVRQDDSKFFDQQIGRYAQDTTRTAKLLAFVAGSYRDEWYSSDFPVISQYCAAKTDVRNCPLIPNEVIEGLLSNTGHPQNRTMWNNVDNRKRTQKMLREVTQATSANQAIRQTKKNEELGVQRTVDHSKVSDFIALYKTGYESGWTDELRVAVDKLAEKRKFANFMYNKIGIILDKSASMSGHAVESRNTPRAIAEFTALVLAKSAGLSSVVNTGEFDTDLASALIDALSHGPMDALFVLSDGYENAYEGLFDEVLGKWREMTGLHMPVYHLSPVLGSEMNAQVRSLGAFVSTVAINKPESVMLQLSTKLLEQDVKAWLSTQVSMLDQLTQTKKTNILI